MLCSRQFSCKNGQIRLVFGLVFLATVTFVAAVVKADSVSFPETLECPYLVSEVSYALNSPHIPAEVTVRTLTSDKERVTRVSISTEFPTKGFNQVDLSVAGITKSGKKLLPTTSSVETVNRKETTLATITCELPDGKTEIGRLLIQYQKSDSPNPMKLELVEVERTSDLTTRWGNVNDLDGDCKIESSDKKLSMTIPPGIHDLAAGRPLNAPFVLNQISGDFIFQVKVTSDFDSGKKGFANGQAYHGAGVLLWDSVDNYLRVERNAYWSSTGQMLGDIPLIEYFQDQRLVGFPTDEASTDFYKSRSTWFKTSRKGKDVTISMSQDGKDWDEIRTVATELPDELFVGVLAVNTADRPLVVEFEDFTLRANRLIAPVYISRKPSPTK